VPQSFTQDTIWKDAELMSWKYLNNMVESRHHFEEMMDRPIREPRVYSAMVASLACPSKTWITRMSTPFSSRMRGKAVAQRMGAHETSACSWKVRLEFKGTIVFRTGRQAAQSIRFMRVDATSSSHAPLPRSGFVLRPMSAELASIAKAALGGARGTAK
jgi:hypothetical protein